MCAVLHRSLTFFHKLEFDTCTFMFTTYTFKVTFVGNIRGKMDHTVLH